jgi:hypothetical protein
MVATSAEDILNQAYRGKFFIPKTNSPAYEFLGMLPSGKVELRERGSGELVDFSWLYFSEMRELSVDEIRSLEQRTEDSYDDPRLDLPGSFRRPIGLPEELVDIK